MSSRHPGSREVEWRRTPSAETPYEADVDGHLWILRVNDFPTRSLYTLLVDGEPTCDLEARPPLWRRPARGERRRRFE